MSRRDEIYKALPVIAFVVYAAPIALVFSGNAEPYASPGDIPVEPPVLVGGAIVAVFGTVFFSIVLINRSFKKAGTSIGLTPEGGGIFGHPSFSGTIGGRRVQVDTRKVNSGGHNSSSTSYTIPKAELDEPLESGFILINGDVDSDPAATSGVPEDVRRVPIDGDFAVIGEANEPRARAVLTPAVRETLNAPGAPAGLVVGDPADAIIDALPEEMASFGELLGGADLESRIREKVEGDAPPVSHQEQGLILSGDRLEERLEAMVAVADAVDNADLSERAPSAEEAA